MEFGLPIHASSSACANHHCNDNFCGRWGGGGEEEQLKKSSHFMGQKFSRAESFPRKVPK